MSGRPLRIVMITTSFPLGPGDPSGVFVAEQAAALRQRGHDVLVLHPEGPRHAPSLPGAVAVPYLRPRTAQVLFGGAGAPDLLEAHPLLHALGPLVAGALWWRARASARGVDAIISHWLLPSGLVGSAVALEHRLPHLAFCHSGDLALLERMPAPSLAARALGVGATRVAFVGAHLRERFVRLAPSLEPRTAVLPMGVAVPRFGQVNRSVRRPGEPLRALFLGRLVPIKGVDVAIRAVAGCPDLCLTVAGAGPERGRLEALARRSSSPSVRFLGRVPTHDVAALIAEHHVVVIPSRDLPNGRTEGTPRVCLEALAAGVPVVASAVGGLRSVAVGRGLQLVPQGDVETLRHALRGLARRTVDPNEHTEVLDLAPFGWVNHVNRVEELLAGAAADS